MVILGRMYFLDMDDLFVDMEYLVEDNVVLAGVDGVVSCSHVAVVMDKELIDEALYPVFPAVTLDKKESCHGPGSRGIQSQT